METHPREDYAGCRRPAVSLFVFYVKLSRNFKRMQRAENLILFIITRIYETKKQFLYFEFIDMTFLMFFFVFLNKITYKYDSLHQFYAIVL